MIFTYFYTCLQQHICSQSWVASASGKTSFLHLQVRADCSLPASPFSSLFINEFAGAGYDRIELFICGSPGFFFSLLAHLVKHEESHWLLRRDGRAISSTFSSFPVCKMGWSVRCQHVLGFWCCLWFVLCCFAVQVFSLQLSLLAKV